MNDSRERLSSPVPAPLRRLRVSEFRRLRQAVYDEAGIYLPDAKLLLVESRLSRRLRELRLRNYEDYCTLVIDHRDAAERVHMLDAITTNETHFFREAKHFDLLRDSVFPEWRAQGDHGERPRRVRAWSAACSTGEEPYTLGMCLLDAFPSSAGWTLDVLGSDLSTRVLERAESATWPIDKVQEIPEVYRKRYMLRGIDSCYGQMRCSPELRALVRFARINLNSPPYPVAGALDLVFCRNVLIYFDATSRERVIDALIDCLSPDGLLVVGHSESLHRLTPRVSPLAPGVYRRKPQAQVS